MYLAAIYVDQLANVQLMLYTVAASDDQSAGTLLMLLL